MAPPSRTPEGEENYCLVCGNRVVVEPSEGSRDAPCPYCGCLLSFERFGNPTTDRGSQEETKRQIRVLVQEIADLSKQTILPNEFFGEFLSRVVAALAAHGGAIWTVSDGVLTLQHSIDLQKTDFHNNEEKQKQHTQLLHKALNEGEAILVPPSSEHSGEDEIENPTDFLLILSPLRAESQPVGLVEIFQRTNSGASVRKGYLRFVTEMCTLASSSPALQACEKKPWWRRWR